MPGLPAAPPAALLPTSPDALLAGQPVRRRRLRGGRGILLAPRELALQLRDRLGLVHQLPSQLGDGPIAFGQGAPQAPDVRSLAWFRHALHGTLLSAAVQDPLNCYIKSEPPACGDAGDAEMG
jgi:hypothetical protein